MTVPAQHHVMLDGVGYMLDMRGYVKQPAPQFGARVSSGDPDYNNLSLWQHWTQTCWAGGLGADTWTDDSMYDQGAGVDSTIHEQLTLSRDLSRPTGGNLNAGSLDVVRKFYIFKGTLHCLTLPSSDGTTSYLWGYNNSTSTWSLTKTFTNWRAMCIFAWNGYLCIGGEGGVIKYSTTASGSYSDRNPPAGVTDPVTAMGGFSGKLYVAYNNVIWRLRPNMALDGTTEFATLGGMDVINCFKTHLAQLWFGSKNAHVGRTDGNNTFDIWNWDGNTYLTSMQSFDGKLFLATYEYSDTTDVGQGVLYQMTGSAVTQLKRWGSFDRATSIGGMIVYDRKMYYGASGLWGMNRVTPTSSDLGGFGVAVYDVVEDAHSIWATNKDTTTYADASGIGRDWVVDDVAFFAGQLHASVRKHGLFKSPLAYRDYLSARAKYDTTSTVATGSSSQGFIRSSDFDGGTPGLLKLWQQVLVQADLPSDNTSVRLSYSLDKGASWSSGLTMSRTLTGTVSTGIASTTVTGSGTLFLREVMPGDSIRFGTQTRTVDRVTSDTSLTLTAVAGALQSGVTAKHNKIRFSYAFRLTNIRSPRFMYRLELLTTADTDSPVVRGISVSYLPQPEPNWQWTLRLKVAERQVLRDGTEEILTAQQCADRIYALETAYRRHVPVTFTDYDGVVWAISGPGVLIWDMTVVRHVSGNATDPPEADIQLTLLEIVETY